MPRLPIYFDHHATTPLDPRVLEAMLPYFGAVFGNAGSTTHSFGWAARAAVDEARQKIAAALARRPKEIVFTSGATESNNLAIRGVAGRHADRGRHIISAATEHHAVLDPLRRLARRRFRGNAAAGRRGSAIPGPASSAWRTWPRPSARIRSSSP